MCALRSIIKDKADGDAVCGVALIPVYIYGAGGSQIQLHGRPCVYLGRETSGKYAHQYNLFGGKVEHGHSASSAVKTLLAEIQEEMGLVVSAQQIKDSLIHVHADKRSGHRRSLMFFVHMTKLNTGRFDRMVQYRRECGVPHAWREHDKSMHFPVSARDTHGLSIYAEKALRVGHKKKVFERVTEIPALSASSLRQIWVPSR